MASQSAGSSVNRLSVSWFVNALAYSIVYPFLPLYLHVERGLPMSRVGLIFPVMGFAVVLGPLVSGYLVDRYGRRPVLANGPLGRAVVFLVLSGLAMSHAPFWAFTVALFFSSLLGTFFQNASDAYITDITTPEERVPLYARIRVGTNVGWLIGPMLGAFLARTPFSLLFAMTAALCVVGGLTARAACPPHAKTRNTPVRRISFLGTFHALRVDPLFRHVVVLCFMLFMLTSQLYSTLSVYASGVVGLSKNQLGFLYSINGLTIIALQIPSTRLGRGLRHADRLIIGAVFYIAGYAAMGLASTWTALAIALFVLSCGELLARPAMFGLVSALAPADGVGRYMGIYHMFSGIAYALGPYVGALLFEQLSSRPVLLWGILASFALPTILGMLRLRDRLPG